MPRSVIERCLLVALLWACWPCAVSYAVQENPFATRQTDPAAPVAELPTVVPEIDPALPEGTRLIFRALRESKPQSDIELAKAIKLMLDVEQYQQAGYYLSRLQSVAADEASLFQVYEAMGSDFFFALHATGDVIPGAREFAKKALSAADKVARSPERISQLVKQLNDENISVRSAAFRRLRRLGAPAVVEMISVFATPERQQEFPGVRTALQSMGSDAVAPLLGAARAPNLQIQAEAIRALENLRSTAATDVMMRTYLSPKLPKSLRRVALDSLMRRNQLPPDPDYVEERFYQRAQEYLLGRGKIAGGRLGQVTIWRWDVNTNRLVGSEVTTATAMRIIAAERAADLYEIRPNSNRNRQMYLLTQLEAAKRIAGPTLRVDVEALLRRFPGTNAAEIEAVLAEAIRLKLIPAATACCELLGEIGTAELIYGASGQPRALVRAMLLGDRHLQYAAFQAISNLNPQQAFAGSSYMLLMAVYLASSENRSAALVGHVRSDIAQLYAGTLKSLGMSGKTVTNSRDFFREAVADPDLEALLITDTLDQPNYAELIQQLRNDLRTKRIPIALLYRNTESKVRLQRLVGSDPFFIALPISLEPEFIGSQITRLRQLADPWPISNLDRRRHSIAAVDWLARIAGDRETYNFYDLGSYQDELTRLLYLPGFADPASQILTQLGTPAAQRELINFASQNGLPLEDRKKAVEAFARAVENGSTLLLTRGEILRQYDRYNASENEPESTQLILGSILDAIESRARDSN
jgi:hypothetical protein